MKTRWHGGMSIVVAGVLAGGVAAAGCMSKRSSEDQSASPAAAAKPKSEADKPSASEFGAMATASPSPPPPPEAAAAAAGSQLNRPMMPGAKGTVGGGGVGQGAAEPTIPGVAPLVPIDANGRFATTYRPGGGHLAAFESAVSRGIIPASEREIVSDIGARYTPTMDAPTSTALAFRTDFERAKLAPSGGPFHVRLALRSTAGRAAERPHLSVHLVLDVSGSMAGESIARARDAARTLVDRLAPTDDFSLVTFSNAADVKVPDGPVGARREAIKKIIGEVHEGGGTNIGGGLELGYAQAITKSIPEDAVRVVLLLSDGRANVGLVAQEKLSKLALDAFQKGIQTSSFGLGQDYDGALMSSIAEDGAGGYYYLRDAEQISPALSMEIDKRLDPVATAVEVRVRLKKGVDLLRVYGSRRLSEAEAGRVRTQEVAADQQAAKRDHIVKDREDDAEGGMRFFIPAFAPDDAHALLFQLSVPPGAGSRPVASIEIKYKDRLSKKNVTDEVPVTVAYADSDASSAATIDPSVSRTVQGFAAGEALSQAASKIAHNDRGGALALLTERETILRQAADTLKEPLFLKDADRLARLRQHAGSTTGVGDSLVLAMLLETAGRSHLH